jgi:DNA-directed RNA polymerase specialized sigma24 family protein
LAESELRRREDSIDELLPRFDEDGHFAEPVAQWEAEAETLLERHKTRTIVRRAIDQLPEKHCTVLNGTTNGSNAPRRARREQAA